MRQPYQLNQNHNHNHDDDDILPRRAGPTPYDDLVFFGCLLPLAIAGGGFILASMLQDLSKDKNEGEGIQTLINHSDFGHSMIIASVALSLMALLAIALLAKSFFSKPNNLYTPLKGASKAYDAPERKHVELAPISSF